MAESDPKQSRFSRWSKRKLEAKAAPEKDVEEPIATNLAEPSEDDEKYQAMLLENKEAAEAVDLETLNKDSDFSVFLKEGVPELLKKKAMQTLWRSNPVFANVDGLCDYDDDFGSPDLNMKVFKSAYQAGKGYAQLLLEDDEKADDLESETSLEENLDPVDDEVVDETTDESLEEQEPAQVIVENENVAANEVSETVETEHLEVMPRVSLRKRLELESEN